MKPCVIALSLCLPIHKIFQHILAHGLPRRRTTRQSLREVSPTLVVFHLLLQKFVTRTFLSIGRQCSRSIHMYVECTWSRNDVGSPRSTSFINFFRHEDLMFCFLPAILMSSTYTDKHQVFAPRNFCTVLWPALGNLGPLLDDLLVVTVGLCLSAHPPASHWRQLFLYCTLFVEQLRFTSSQLSLDLFDSGGLTHVRLCARSHASPRVVPPLLESAWCPSEFDLGNLEDVHDRISSILSTNCGSGLVVCFWTCCVSFRATSRLTSPFSVTGRSTNSWPRVQGLICWRRTRSLHLSECVIASG